MHHSDKDSGRSLRVVTTEPCLQLRVDDAIGGVMLRPQRFPDSLPARGEGTLGKGRRRSESNQQEGGIPASSAQTQDKKEYATRFAEQSVVHPGDFHVNNTVYSLDLGN